MAHFSSAFLHSKACSSASHNLKGSIEPPSDKSISHRALILGGLAKGITKIKNLLESADVYHTKDAMEKLGAKIYKDKDIWIVHGVGNGCLLEPDSPLDFGNSGTGARLIMGLVGTYPIKTSFIGDRSLSKRPMDRVLDPLKKMGLQILAQEGRGLPLTITGPKIACPISYHLPVASAQVKSALLLAALNTKGVTTLVEPIKTRDHSERMLKKFGVELTIEEDPEKLRSIHIKGEQILYGQDISIPADPSSAAFLIVAALITKNSDITLKNILMNDTRIGLLKTLQEMGADIEILQSYNAGGEEVADLRIRSSQLKGVTVPADRSASMIDEYPILAIAAAHAQGKTTMLGLEELRVKESDRLHNIALGLKENGVKCIEGEDFMIVEGQSTPPKGGATLSSKNDHRIAMSFLVLGLTTLEPILVNDPTTISTSFPNFFESFQQIGAEISLID